MTRICDKPLCRSKTVPDPLPMKSNLSHKSLGLHRVRMNVAAILGSILIFAANVGLEADEPSRQEPDPTPRVDLPFDSDAMPPADKLLGKSILASPYWTAKISVSATSTDASIACSLLGELFRNGQHFAAKLRLTGDADREVNLLLSQERSVAWTTSSLDQEEVVLKRLAKAIYLFGALNEVPGQSELEANSITNYQLTNLGIANHNSDRLYVIEAKPKDGESNLVETSPLDPKLVLITISVSDSRPHQISATASDGSRLDLKFQSIEANAPADSPQYANEPPKDSFVIDLSEQPATGDALKNPVPYTADSIKRGKRIYVADCVVCHSVDGTGRDSDVTDNAADLTDTEFWLSDGSESATFLAIRDGAGDEMPGYKDDYRDEKMIWDLVNYIRSLQE